MGIFIQNIEPDIYVGQENNIEIYNEDELLYPSSQPQPVLQGHLRFKSKQNGTTFSFTNPVQYSVDSGATWTTLSANTASPSIASGDTIMWKAELTPVLIDGVGTFSSTGQYEADGNPMSLLFGDNFSGVTSLSGNNYAFSTLFQNSSGLTSAENLELLATTLAYGCYDSMFAYCEALTAAPDLPADTMADYCYHTMFNGCTSLTDAPVLSASTLADNCYDYMFSDCTSLENAPVLSATTLADYCYQGMFAGCTSLTTAPELPATTLTSMCYAGMFERCTYLMVAPELSASTLTEGCYQYMFFGCQQIDHIVMLATDISAEGCLDLWLEGVAPTGTFVKDPTMHDLEIDSPSGIPEGWSGGDLNYLAIKAMEDNISIGSHPNDGSTLLYYSTDEGTTWEEAWGGMINPQNPIMTGDRVLLKKENDLYSGSWGDIYVNGQFELEGNIMSLLYGDNFEGETNLSGANQIFQNLFRSQTGLTSIEHLDLPAESLGSQAYDHMFEGCSNLTTMMSVLPATELGDSCYASMFQNCSSLTIPSSDSVVMVDAYLTFGTHTWCEMMFANCTSLEYAPMLMTEMLGYSCYQSMFWGCSNLIEVVMLAQDVSGNYFSGWLNSVASNGTLYVTDTVYNSGDMQQGFNGYPYDWNLDVYQPW